MPDEYNSSYTGAQIDNAVGKALSPDSTPTENSTNLVTSGGVKSALDAKTDQTDLTTIKQTSPTCTETNGIAAGVFFYLDNELVVAKTAIVNGATFTLNTNYEVPTAGALNALKSALINDQTWIYGYTSNKNYIDFITEGVVQGDIRIFQLCVRGGEDGIFRTGAVMINANLTCTVALAVSGTGSSTNASYSNGVLRITLGSLYNGVFISPWDVGHGARIVGMA